MYSSKDSLVSRTERSWTITKIDNVAVCVFVQYLDGTIDMYLRLLRYLYVIVFEDASVTYFHWCRDFDVGSPSLAL